MSTFTTRQVKALDDAFPEIIPGRLSEDNTELARRLREAFSTMCALAPRLSEIPTVVKAWVTMLLEYPNDIGLHERLLRAELDYHAIEDGAMR